MENKKEFFQQIADILEIGEMIDIRIKKVDEELSIVAVPSIKGKFANIKMVGMPYDLDCQFMAELSKPLQRINGVVSNADTVKIEVSKDVKPTSITAENLPEKSNCVTVENLKNDREKFDNAVVDLKKNRETYAGLLKQSDQAIKDRKYAEALELANQAIAIFPSEPKAKDKVRLAKRWVDMINEAKLK